MNKAFIYLCTVIALFVSLSGMTSIRRPSDAFVHLLFLPVTIYLCSTSLSYILHPKRTNATPSFNNHTTILSGIMILLLIVIIAKVISILLVKSV